MHDVSPVPRNVFLRRGHYAAVDHRMLEEQSYRVLEFRAHNLQRFTTRAPVCGRHGLRLISGRPSHSPRRQLVQQSHIEVKLRATSRVICTLTPSASVYRCASPRSGHYSRTHREAEEVVGAERHLLPASLGVVDMSCCARRSVVFTRSDSDHLVVLARKRVRCRFREALVNE
ncbi:hypothetical protein EXIGLDRAFT_152169 [Exidia glandulosa HHB12029]|uniref:Uncharacterized protein n=1 Tax=Exidia glandulosa HHB12029 TaxID=1314781 RepID=A0A165QEM5_EXIGL|nr:hypothetical protein EXIGLDRAFT_152169 [Exidia glandulosa HHB12029]